MFVVFIQTKSFAPRFKTDQVLNASIYKRTSYQSSMQQSRSCVDESRRLEVVMKN